MMGAACMSMRSPLDSSSVAWPVGKAIIIPLSLCRRSLWRAARALSASNAMALLVSDAASGAASSPAAPAASGAFSDTTQIVQKRLIEAKQRHISWRTVLNNHTSARPNAYGGGKLCDSVEACKTFDTFGSMHSCRIILPNSYAPEDGKVVEVESIAPEKHEAEEDAECATFAVLCSDSAHLSDVIFRPAHWNVPIDDLIYDIARIIEDPLSRLWRQPLAAHQGAAASGAMVAGGLQNVPVANLEQAADLIRLCLRAHDGCFDFDPSKIDHKKIEQMAGPHESARAHLAALLPKESLRQFIEQSQEFDIDEIDRILYIKWRGAGCAAPQLPPPGGSGDCDPVTSASAASGALSASGHYTNISRIERIAKEHPPVEQVIRHKPPIDPADETRRVLNDGDDDRAALSDFWRVGPGRMWKRPS